jgi:MFS family permease
MTTGPTRALNLAAVVSLLFGNLVMTINQVNIASIFTFGTLSHASSISKDFNLSVYGLGILTSAFFLAYGAFEVPGGALAAKMGPKKIVIYGTVANALGVLGSALSPQFDALAVFRFVAGFGFAFAFPSILVLLVRYYKAGSEGFGVALMSVSAAVGSVTGYFGWAVLGGSVGWRPALLIAGVLDVISAVAMITSIPSDRMEPQFHLNLGHLKAVVADKALAVLCVALFGIGSTFGLVNNFMIYYLEGNFGLSPGAAGSITSISAVLPILSAPIMGRVYDRVKNLKLLLLAPAAMVSLGVGIASIDSIYAAFITVILAGIASGMVFTVALAGAREVASSNPEYESMTVAWVDSFGLFGNSVSPLYFSALVLATGYSEAWLIGGAVAVLMTLPILLVKNEAFRKKVVTTIGRQDA